MYISSQYDLSHLLYTDISHSDGIEACREMCDSREFKYPPTDWLYTLIIMVLKKNKFSFDGDHILQINGTAIVSDSS